MTPGQNAKYWRRWAFVCRANGWRWLKGRLVEEAVKTASPFHAGVWALGEQIAQQHCRAPFADDLRHACHVMALGRDLSHDALTNDQFNRLLLLWGDEKKLPGLLINPEHVRSIMFWNDPDMQKKDSLVWAIKAAAPDEYIEKITSDIWGTKYWEDLETPQLLGLLRKLKGTRPARA